MWKWHKYSISEAQGRQLMHTESTLVCLFISPLISVVLLLMSPGSRWHSKPFNHRLIHTHTRTHTFAHISHSRASRPITDSPSIIFPDTVLIRRQSLLAIGLTECVCNHFGYRTGTFCTHGCLMGFEVIVLDLPCIFCHGLTDWWSVIDRRLSPNALFDSWDVSGTVDKDSSSQKPLVDNIYTTCGLLVTDESNLYTEICFTTCSEWTVNHETHWNM